MQVERRTGRWCLLRLFVCSVQSAYSAFFQLRNCLRLRFKNFGGLSICTRQQVTFSLYLNQTLIDIFPCREAHCSDKSCFFMSKFQNAEHFVLTLPCVQQAYTTCCRLLMFWKSTVNLIDSMEP